MRILLLGDYSNVHHTLGQGLRRLGHEVVVASDGDGWKNYPRDVDLRRSTLSPWGSAVYFLRLLHKFRHFRGFDVVQLINPVFLPLKAERMMPFYRYLRRHNRHIVLGAFGMDYYYVKACLDFRTFRYSDFNMGSRERISEENEIFKRDWLYGPKGRLNRALAADADAIVSGLYEYEVSYRAQCPQAAGKLHFIPFPIIFRQPDAQTEVPNSPTNPLKIFIGIQKTRSVYKGTDIMLRAARRVAEQYPDACRLQVAQNVPFAQYVEMLNTSNVLLDQLYSYTPAMNALEAMARGMIVVGGGEPESYDLLGEKELRPIVNVAPNEESVYQALCQLVEQRVSLVPRLREESLRYIHRHHDYVTVARRYEKLYRQFDICRS